MRLPTNYIFRSLCALLVGFLLVSNPSTMTSLIVQIIGGLFAVSGILAFIGYFISSHRTRKTRERIAALAASDDLYVPAPSTINLVAGVASVALGAVLIIWPDLFINILMYVLGALLVLIGFYQLMSLINFRRIAPLSFALFLMPVLIIAAGIVIILYPMQTAALSFTILGIAYICYGVTEFFYGLRLHRFQKQYDENLTQLQNIEDAVFEEVNDVPTAQP